MVCLGNEQRSFCCFWDCTQVLHFFTQVLAQVLPQPLMLKKLKLTGSVKTYSTFQFCQENALVIANTLSQQHKRRFYTWTSPDSQYWNQIDCILWSQRWRSSIQSAKTRLGADCGSDHELLIAKFRLKLKKVGKITRPFRYDLNKIPYNYTVEVRNKIQGVRCDRVPE